MKVMLLTDEYQRSDNIGGGHVVAQQIAAVLKSRGHVIAVCSAREPFTDQLPHGGIAQFQVICPKDVWKSSGLIKFYRCLLGDRRDISKSLSLFRPDVIYCLHQRGIAVPTISFVNTLRVPLVYRMGDEWLRLHYYAEKYDVNQYWSNCRGFLTRLVIRSFVWLNFENTGLFARSEFSARYIVCNSSDLAYRIFPFIKNSICKIQIVKNGIDLDAFRFRSRQCKRSPRLLYVGRLVGHKGVHLLPEMMMHIRSTPQCKDASLTIVGSSDDIDCIGKLRKSVYELGLSSVVRLQGLIPHSEMPRCYEEHDILVFPSLARSSRFTVEGCPSVLDEAMA